MGFYRRNYIEGLFPLLRRPPGPGLHHRADDPVPAPAAGGVPLRRLHPRQGHSRGRSLLTQQLGLLADRLSVNIELPSAQSLALLAPDKKKQAILAPMGQIRDGITVSKQELKVYRHAPGLPRRGSPPR